MKIKNIKKIFAVFPLLILASCTSNNNSLAVSDLDEDIVNTWEVEEVGDLSGDSSSETLNENIKNTEVAKWNWFWWKQYRWWDTNSKAS